MGKDILREKLLKRLKYEKLSQQEMMIELNNYDYQKKNIKPFQKEVTNNE